MKNLTYSLYSQKQTVFTAKEIAMLLELTDMDLVKSRINYYVKRGIIKALRRGLYAKNNGYEPEEAATKIYIPSYVSLETVLLKKGAVFQYDERIYVISYQAREITVDNYRFVYRKIKNEVLVNQKGLEKKDGYYIASIERAFLDALYLYKDYYFDNLAVVNFKKAETILPIYNSKALIRRFNEYQKNRKA